MSCSVYSSKELEAMRELAWGHIKKANEGLERKPIRLDWAIQVGARTRLVLNYVDGDTNRQIYTIIL